MTERTVPRLKFKKDFDFKPSSQSTVGYKAGWEGPVTQACADAAVKAGVAELVTGSTKKADA
ncbi:hypothetical protein SAMN05216456_1913 [Devosia crocina]|uniref:Uncharacterized protein n=1 Tax=Devosia crocina TaxID=429728 RepID=A0A1I7NF63_9HYPH|nr:hypothetical protein [Devosia crocina]SFV33186.1 hypothetical protein SAMN05216456_1913 [Devosia crocina]